MPSTIHKDAWEATITSNSPTFKPRPIGRRCTYDWVFIVYHPSIADYSKVNFFENKLVCPLEKGSTRVSNKTLVVLGFGMSSAASSSSSSSWLNGGCGGDKEDNRPPPNLMSSIGQIEGGITGESEISSLKRPSRVSFSFGFLNSDRQIT